MDKQQIIAFSGNRSIMYRFLGGLYLMEVDAEQLAELKKMAFPVICGDSDPDLDLQEGYQLLQEEIRILTEDDLDDLAADYAKIFLAAGDATGKAAFPYESVYVDKKHQVGGSTEMQMKALYLDRGFEPDPDVYRTMYDHIGLIFEYMGILCEELTKALESGDHDKAGSLLAEQKDLLKKHITNWVYSLTSDVVKFAERDFYKGIAKVTNGFIKKETELLKEGGAAWDIE